MSQASTAQADDLPVAAVAAEKKSIWPKMLIGMVLVGGLSGGGAWFYLSGKNPPAEGEVVAPERTIYTPLEPAFVVNLDSDEINRYLQIDVQVMSHDEKVVELLEHEMPLIRNRLILLFGAQKYEAISSREGKEALQQQSLEEIRGVLEAAGHPDTVKAVYFTSFIIQ
tara:strand:+ start:39868 stop:40371 length:504 start_codon:yes stop_codon:yes gene_type:complete